MKKLNYLTLTLIFSFFILSSCSDTNINQIPTNFASELASNIDAKYATDWMQIEYDIVADQHDDSPPPPSRMYAYTCIAIYECVAPAIPNSRSLAGQLNQMPQMPSINPSLRYDWPMVIAAAVPIVMRRTFDTLYPGAQNLVDLKYNQILNERSAIENNEVIQRSINHGIAIANKIVEWADGDRYLETRTMNYTPPSRLENWKNWEPINPGDEAIEPYWGLLRPFIIPSAQQFYPPLPFELSSNSGTEFHNQHQELVTVSQNLTIEQKRIANFWNDKIRTGCPSGHWVSIMNIIARQLQLKLDRVAQMFALMGPNMGDAFIACWGAKYHFNTLRPQSFIRDYINSNWYPFLITPPFPAYPSGHSVMSGSCAEVMTYLFGDVAFVDNTHQNIGYLPRSFTSFRHAANEAGYSRLYGGIHPRLDIDRGLETGRSLGTYVINNIRLTN
jgi:membrane-associated phospholipid phosphatase